MKKYTFEELYDLAMDTPYGDPRLKAKDWARWEIECLIQETEGYDVCESECPEEEIFGWLEDHKLWFDEFGRLIEVEK